jgi:hypothetical protein
LFVLSIQKAFQQVQGPVPQSAVTDRGGHDDHAEKQDKPRGCALFTIRKLWIETREKTPTGEMRPPIRGQPPSTQAATA